MTAMTELVGRGRELESLATHVASGRPVLVSGEAGIGKTSLMRAAAAHSGLPVFWGRCLATLWWVSHQPLRQAISLSETEAAGDPLAVSDLVRRRVGDGVLVLDDVQWADPGTWALLPLLAGEIRMMTAVRSGQPGFRAHAERLIAASFERCVVGPLDTGAIVAVVRQVCPDLDPTRVGNVAAAAGGNPLLAEEFARAGGPSARLDALVSTRVIDLPARERLALARLALLGRPASQSLAARLCSPEALEALAQAELLEPQDDTWAVRHGLIGEWAVAAVSPAERVRLHREIADALDTKAEKAQHLAAAGEHRLAYELSLAAAQDAATPGERVAQLRLAAECADGDAAELRIAAVAELVRARECEAALDLAATVDAADPETRAWLRYWQTHAHGRLFANEEAAAAAAEGFRLAPPGSEVELRLREEHIHHLMFVDWNPVAALTEATEVTRAADAAGVSLPLAEILGAAAGLFIGQQGWEDCFTSFGRSGRANGDWNLAFEADQALVVSLHMDGRTDKARKIAAETAGDADAVGLARWAIQLRVLGAATAFFAGDYPEVLDSAPRLLARHPAGRDRDLLCAIYCMALVDCGYLDAAREIVLTAERDAVTPTGTVALPLVRAEIAYWGGRAPKAVEIFQAHPPTGAGGVATLLMRPTFSWACLGTGRDVPPPLPGLPLRIIRGPSSETTAVALLAEGSPAAAAERFADAVEEYAGCAFRSEIRSRMGLGIALVRAGESRRGIEALREARALAADSGLVPLLRRIETELAAAGVAALPRSSATDADGAAGTTDESSLSGRERQALALVASGYTYAQIGRRLGLSPRTVETYIRNARRKLGARSRAEAIRLAQDASRE